ncbi:putative MPP superfamily phosphohydrolase [Psychrobacter sp. PL15]|uniref:metallophosphoesterase n=1 Tax=Psychrobacter sp. PL15 TaxID=3071719 RepID=UPI002E02C7CF|nr:putative MPP superfamily phosphohydrolase [Psychrobacter sp. PL15]
MWLFIVLTQLLAVTTSVILWWLIQPQRPVSKTIIVLSVFIINNLALIYGLSEFWRERFYVYLVVSILQGFMVYAALITAAVALFYSQIIKRPSRPKLIRAIAALSYMGIVGLAVFNAYSPVVHRLTVTTDKPLDKPMTMALVSDTHLGRWFGNRQLDQLASLIDAQNPDVVVLAGDIMNDSTAAYDKTDMHAYLSKLQAPLGVYAVLGNHDYSGNQVAIATAITRAGIKVIDNKSVYLDDAVWLVGRSDATDPRPRKLAADLLTPIDTDKPVIFLEHALWSINEISALPIDLHLSGHTHGGQMFPLTELIQMFTPLVYGAKSIDDTQFLVTSGYGFGAVPFRLGTRAEIWLITLQSTISSPLKS